MRASLLGVVLLVGCSPAPAPTLALAPVPVPVGAEGAQLLLQQPELDQRLLAVDPASGAVRATYFPDRWEPEVGQVLDLALDARRLYLLLALRGGGGSAPWLYVVQRKGGELVQRIKLPAAPYGLSWDCHRRLWVGHGGVAGGPAGRVSLVDVERLRLSAKVPLLGQAVALAAVGRRAWVVERTVRQDEHALAVLSSLAEVDPTAGRVVRRRALPPGVRAMAVGPSGHLYLAHASGEGTWATDGTISVIQRSTLRTVRRLRPQMVVRRMLRSRGLLLLNMLTSTGDVWISALDIADATRFDFRMGQPVGGEMGMSGDTLYLPLPRGRKLLPIELRQQRVLPRLQLRTPAGGPERPGLLRTRMVCHGA